MIFMTRFDPKPLYKFSIHWIESLNRQDWLIALTVCAVLGLLCMRGFGSRKFY